MGRRRLLACLVALAALTAVAPGEAYRIAGRPWPKGTVTYFNAAPDQHWAVSQAIDAWNRSGANVRFVRSTQDRAQLVIQHFAGSSGSCVPHALASVGYTPSGRAVVYVSPWGAHSACSSHATALAVAHELGHVLGLGHESRACAGMNPVGDYQGGYRCPRASPWEWRCRLLEEDDVRGAVALYGGSVRPLRNPAVCPVYAGIRAPAGLTVDVAGGGLSISFRRPGSPRIPDFLLRLGAGAESFVLRRSLDSCPTRLDGGVARYRWSVQAGDRQRFTDRLPGPGRYCYSAWAVDALGRPSAKPATAWHEVG